MVQNIDSKWVAQGGVFINQRWGLFVRPRTPGPRTKKPLIKNLENGNNFGRNYVGRFTRTGCTGMLVQVLGLHHKGNTTIFLVALS